MKEINFSDKKTLNLKGLAMRGRIDSSKRVDDAKKHSFDSFAEDVKKTLEAHSRRCNQETKNA